MPNQRWRKRRAGKPVEHLDEFPFFLRWRARLGRPVTPETMDDWFCSEEQESSLLPMRSRWKNFCFFSYLKGAADNQVGLLCASQAKDDEEKIRDRYAREGYT